MSERTATNETKTGGYLTWGIQDITGDGNWRGGGNNWREKASGRLTVMLILPWRIFGPKASKYNHQLHHRALLRTG